MAATNYDVELANLKDAQSNLFKFKILVLGAGESGKSTIIKQLKAIHSKNQSFQNENDQTKLVITSLHQNVADCIKALALACGNFGHKLSEQDYSTIEMMENKQHENWRISPDEAVDVIALWNSKGFQKTYKKRNTFWILDAWPYYIQHLERIASEDFVPNEDDNLMARIRTTGIVTTELVQKVVPKMEDEPDTISFVVVDVGGQRNERKKWISCFDDVKSVMFVVNLAGYNQVLFEDSSMNRMHEAKSLFKATVNNQMFRDTPVFLFLNKKDLFEEMIQETDLNCCFPDYEGGLNVQSALKHVEKEFVQEVAVSAAAGEPKKIKCLKVTASIRKDVKTAFEEVKESLYFTNTNVLMAKLRDFKSREDQIRKQMNKKSGDCCVLM